ncbi:MAG TPA: hypothetical protein VHQ01_00915 [Pyrinomonadaceae bacterium]|nr:hypothetical protein [Pyrinomonadaceae bacterium]
MAEANGISKLAGRAGMLIAFVGLLAFFAGVFSFVPRMVMVAGIALIALSLVSFFVEEFEQRRG